MWMELIVFAGKAVVITAMIGSLVMLIALMIARSQHTQELEVEPLHSHLKDIGFFLKSFRLTKQDRKTESKKQKEDRKKEKTEKKEKALYVIRFKGDIRATQTDSLREEVTAILQAAGKDDEVLCVLDSPGGVVNGYGFAASQLLRLRTAGLHLTVAVDEVAASGGYLMACVAHQVLAAPFAIIGSIGVVAQVPNFHRILKKHDVDYKEYTAGEFKRTVSIMGEITPKGEEKFREQLEETHGLFKHFVGRFRPQIDLNSVATGEYWYGERALVLGLVDKLQTSDDFILQRMKDEFSILQLRYQKSRSFQEKIADLMGKISEKTWVRLSTHFERQKYF